MMLLLQAVAALLTVLLFIYKGRWAHAIAYHMKQCGFSTDVRVNEEFELKPTASFIMPPSQTLGIGIGVIDRCNIFDRPKYKRDPDHEDIDQHQVEKLIITK